MTCDTRSMGERFGVFYQQLATINVATLLPHPKINAFLPKLKTGTPHAKLRANAQSGATHHQGSGRTDMNMNANTAVRSLSNVALAAMCCSILVMGAVSPAMAVKVPAAQHMTVDGDSHVALR
ncbi:hypothetical protein [Stakelama marina]|uniref:Uncharacterized protein n=1 Tax=Stakelama marina TaxID=2826939 RepID=A0A8T4IBQ9_9SPHN|nr:hypothetical protein [Stakelama marina]MBR0551883.1 hypothetical protein [Stakelama marina]